MSTTTTPTRDDTRQSHASPTRTDPGPTADPGTNGFDTETLAPLRKAAILLVCVEESLAAQLLNGLDRAAVEAVTLEMARLDAIEPDQQRAVLQEFYTLGQCGLRFLFDDIARLADRDIRTAYDDEDAATWALALAGPRVLSGRRCLARCVRTRPRALNAGLP